MSNFTNAPLNMLNFANVPMERDETRSTPNHSQIGLERADPIDPATSCLRGSITFDQKHGFSLEWESKEAFKDWLDNEQTAQSIELRPSKIEHGSVLYTTNQIFWCARNGMGGFKAYQKKTTCERKIESKRIAGSCPCHMQIKTYPHTAIVLGKYITNHSHLIRMDNLKFIQIRDSTCEMIASMLRYGKNDKDIVSDPSSDNNWSDLLSAEKGNVWCILWTRARSLHYNGRDWPDQKGDWMGIHPIKSQWCQVNSDLNRDPPIWGAFRCLQGQAWSPSGRFTSCWRCVLSVYSDEISKRCVPAAQECVPWYWCNT